MTATVRLALDRKVVVDGGVCFEETIGGSTRPEALLFSFLPLIGRSGFSLDYSFAIGLNDEVGECLAWTARLRKKLGHLSR